VAPGKPGWGSLHLPGSFHMYYTVYLGLSGHRYPFLWDLDHTAVSNK